MPEKEPENKSPAKKRFVPKRLSKAEMDNITSQIDQRLHDFVKEGKYKDVLIAMGNLGKYSLNNQIYILMQMPEATTVHECGHALAHSAYREDFEGLTPSEKREIKEIEAESIACVVCTFLGLDTQNFNFSYITGWADGDIDKFRENIDVISRHARTLIKVIQKEMVVEANKEKESGEVKAEGPATPPLQISMPMIPEAKNQEIEMA